jgi:hypothetical protein
MKAALAVTKKVTARSARQKYGRRTHPLALKPPTKLPIPLCYIQRVVEEIIVDTQQRSISMQPAEVPLCLVTRLHAEKLGRCVRNNVRVAVDEPHGKPARVLR